MTSEERNGRCEAAVRPRVFRTVLTLLLFAVLATGCATDKAKKTKSGHGVIDRLKTAREALAKAPDNPERNYQYGNALFDVGSFGEAAQAYEHALQLDPAMAKAYTNLGLAFRRLGEVEAAMGAYAQALELTPDDLTTWENLRVATELLGDPDRAGRCLERLGALKPSSPDAQIRQAELLYQVERYEEAARAYERILAARAGDPEDYYVLGLCWFSARQWDAAEAAWKRGLERDPRNPSIHKGLAVLYWTKGDKAGARKEADTCQQLNIPLDPEFLQNLDTPAGEPKP